MRMGRSVAGLIVSCKIVDNRRLARFRGLFGTFRPFGRGDAEHRPAIQGDIARPYRGTFARGDPGWRHRARRAAHGDSAVVAIRCQPRAPARGAAPAHRRGPAGDGALYRHARGLALRRGRSRDLFAAHCARDLRLRAGLGSARCPLPRRATPPKRRRCWPASMPATTGPASRPNSSCTAWCSRPVATSCCSAPGTGCAVACSSIGLRTIAPTAAVGRGATATTATSRRRSGADLDALRREIADHMRRGAVVTEKFVSGKSKKGNKS